MAALARTETSFKLAHDLDLDKQIEVLVVCSENRALVSLDISHTCFEDLSFLSAMVQLEELDVSGCRQLMDVSPLAYCTCLRKLVMWQSATYANASDTEQRLHGHVSAHSNYPRMQLLNRSLSFLPSLQEIYLGVSPAEVGTCGWITQIDFVKQLQQLRLLSLRGCNKLRDVSPLAHCTALQVADLRDVAYSVEKGDLNALTGCPSLVRLVLGQDEFDSDPADHIAAGLLKKIVLAPSIGFGNLEHAISMTASYASLKDSSSWGFENMLCF